MGHRSRLVEVLYRAETGPIPDESDFERKLVAPTIKRLAKQYALPFDPSTIVPSDDDLADRVFQAGMDFAVEVGMFCQSTNRRIVWTRPELEEGLRYCPAEVIMGMGHDAAVAPGRGPGGAPRGGVLVGGRP